MVQDWNEIISWIHQSDGDGLSEITFALAERYNELFPDYEVMHITLYRDPEKRKADIQSRLPILEKSLPKHIPVMWPSISAPAAFPANEEVSNKIAGCLFNDDQLDHLTEAAKADEFYQDMHLLRSYFEPDYQRILNELSEEDRYTLRVCCSFSEGIRSRLANIAYFLTPKT